MTELEWYALLLLISVFISSLSQVLLKKAALRTHTSVVKEYLDPYIVIAYSIFAIVTLLSIYAYRVVPLSMGPVLESTSYIYVTVLGRVFFDEKITIRKMCALGLILGGICLFFLGG